MCCLATFRFLPPNGRNTMSSSRKSHPVSCFPLHWTPWNTPTYAPSTIHTVTPFMRSLLFIWSVLVHSCKDGSDFILSLGFQWLNRFLWLKITFKNTFNSRKETVSGLNFLDHFFMIIFRGLSTQSLGNEFLQNFTSNLMSLSLCQNVFN